MAYLLIVFEIVVGILLLFGGGELFVAGSVALSLLLGIPQLVIGLTVVSLGTSAPELFVSLLATTQGGSGGDALAVSNIVGSNIFNVLVVLGASAVVMPLRVNSRLVRRDVPLLFGVSMATWGMASGGRLTWIAGLALLSGTVINLIWEIVSAREEPAGAGDDFEDDGAAPAPVAAAKLAGGLVLLVIGSQLLVKGATAAALGLGVSETVIGLTIVAAGTSMPELVTSVVAAYRGKGDLAIGNVVGSNLLNQLVILGLCATVSGGRGLGVEQVMISRDFPIMVATTLACLPIFWSGGVITRTEGWLLLGLYGCYLLEQILLNTVPGALDEFRLVVLVAVLPASLLFITWGALQWRKRRLVGG
ncbi:calcium/sodium antiporter [Cyanobium sp. Morenito 9A2]|uniref:calcium/sodium antiporter n=1 Tax=Cyanobium sp. Morenito 9A2 TaxID=2823718 RepID=UPI0020CECC19|nr:calcium/sodium antiporter [Cyanobium sp. Morenito 9A2]MCP9850190.1 calcium/sodium antiporter [Cyanobium sp. Morenito 9A2]